MPAVDKRWLNRYPHMVHEYYVARVRELAAERHERVRGLRTRAQAAAYVDCVRKRIRRAAGPFPKRTPLHAQTAGVVEDPSYVMEKVVFESRPEFLVTGNLYRPRRIDAPAPAVLGLCGHSNNGKASAAYQAFCQGLAKKGFVALLIDPLGQGERHQYSRADGPEVAGCCAEHNLIGAKLRLMDRWLGTWRVWDAMRALDYLCARPDVDGSCLGATGISGGGTMTTWLTAVEPRLTWAAPGCFNTTFLRNLENEIPADDEQYPPGAIGAGLDHADFILAYAPRPTIFLAQQEDYFDLRGAREGFEDVRRVYGLLGAAQNVQLYVGPSTHGYKPDSREAMYAFALRQAGRSGSSREGKVTERPEEELCATPRGNTHAAGSRRVFEFAADQARALAKSRKRLTGRRLADKARDLLALESRQGEPAHRVLYNSRKFDPDSCRAFQFAVETEPGILAILTPAGRWIEGKSRIHMSPPVGPVTVYLGHEGGQADFHRLAWLRKRARQENVFLLDPRGLGQSEPLAAGIKDSFHFYGPDYLYAGYGNMLGEPYLGRRVHDVLCVLDWLREHGATRLHLLGHGLGSVMAAFAGLLHPARPRVSLAGYLPSYELLATTPVHRWPLSVQVPGVLRWFDLPDVYRALGRRLTRREAWDALMRKPRARKRRR